MPYILVESNGFFKEIHESEYLPDMYTSVSEMQPGVPISGDEMEVIAANLA
jgi:hypothetical protein